MFLGGMKKTEYLTADALDVAWTLPETVDEIWATQKIALRRQQQQ